MKRFRIDAVQQIRVKGSVPAVARLRLVGYQGAVLVGVGDQRHSPLRPAVAWNRDPSGNADWRGWTRHGPAAGFLPRRGVRLCCT
jgi:hypothetical protein